MGVPVPALMYVGASGGQKLSGSLEQELQAVVSCFLMCVLGIKAGSSAWATSILYHWTISLAQIWRFYAFGVATDMKEDDLFWELGKYVFNPFLSQADYRVQIEHLSTLRKQPENVPQGKEQSSQVIQQTYLKQTNKQPPPPPKNGLRFSGTHMNSPLHASPSMSVHVRHSFIHTK